MALDGSLVCRCYSNEVMTNLEPGPLALQREFQRAVVMRTLRCWARSTRVQKL